MALSITTSRTSQPSSPYPPDIDTNHDAAKSGRPRWASQLETLRWKEHFNDESCLWDHDKRRLILSSEELALVAINLPLPQQDSTEVRFQISRPDWNGTTGVFFGFEQTDIRGNEFASADLFQVVRSLDKQGNSIYELRRRAVLLREGSRMEGFPHPTQKFPCPTVAARIPHPNASEFYELRIVFGNNRITNVYWNDVPLPSLTKRTDARWFIMDQRHGQWGVMNHYGTTWVRHIAISKPTSGEQP